MAKRLFSTTDREESHKKLEEVLLDGAHPRAECREADAEGFYSVWDGPQRDGTEVPADPIESELAGLDESKLARLADMIAARLKGGG